MPGPLDTQAPSGAALPPPPRLDSLKPVSLFLDFDGTLVDIAQRPDAIAVAPELPSVLEALSDRLEGRLAVVSGRALADLAAHLPVGGIAMAGSHGGEFRASGSAAVEPLATPLPAPASEALRSLADAHPGLQIEPKPFSMAVHYRHRPEAERDVLALADELGEALALTVKRGKMVVELLTAGADKGSAVRKFMAATPFAGTIPLFLGDDVTDEDAFAAAAEFAGGGGILVGPERKTSAVWRLDDVAAVHGWLKAALA